MIINSPEVSNLRKSILRVSVRDSLQHRTTLEKLSRIHNEISGSEKSQFKDAKELMVKMRTASQKEKLKIKGLLDKNYSQSEADFLIDSSAYNNAGKENYDKENMNPNDFKFTNKKRQEHVQRQLKVKSKLDKLHSRLKIEKQGKTDRFYKRNVKPFLNLDSYIDVHNLLGEENKEKSKSKTEKLSLIHQTLKDIRRNGKDMTSSENPYLESDSFYLENYDDFFPKTERENAQHLQQDTLLSQHQLASSQLSSSTPRDSVVNNLPKRERKFFGMNVTIKGKLDDHIQKEMAGEHQTDKYEEDNTINGLFPDF